MRNKKLIIIIILILMTIGIVFLVSGLENEEEFVVDTILLKASIKKSGSFDGKIKITNLKDEIISLNAKLIGLEGIAFLKESNFDLASGEVKILSINFSNPGNLNESIYIGGLEISNNDKRLIPIVLEIESDDVLFDSNIELFPINIIAGNKINSDIKIFDLSKVGIASLEVNYFIKSIYGETVVSESENIVIKDQVSITKSFILPENIKTGDYVFGVVIKYKNSIGTASSFFTVGISEDTKKTLDINNTIILLILGFIIFVLLLFVFYFVYSRDKLLIELRSQYRAELKREEKYLKEKERKLEAKLKTREEKEVSKKLFKKVRAVRRKIIKEIEKKREEELKKLRKVKKRSEMKRQIEKWKKRGYNISILEKKAKIPTEKIIREQVKAWREKGYDTSVLGKDLKSKF